MSYDNKCKITYMDAASQDPVAEIEQAVFALRHARPGGRGPAGIEHHGQHGGPPWMRDAPAHLEHQPMLRGRRGPGGGMLGGAARFRLLGALRDHDGMSVSEVAETIGVDQPRASRLVNDAAERGLVTRKADERDARRSVVRLTDAGRAMLQTVAASRRSAVSEALEGFTPEETATFAQLLTRFTAVWQQHRH